MRCNPLCPLDPPSYDAPVDTVETETNEMEVEQIPPEPPINLKDLAIFQAFNCPVCEFKSTDRILFKTHVIENHDYVKGKQNIIS